MLCDLALYTAASVLKGKRDWDLGNEAIRTADQNALEKKKARVAAVKSIVLFESGKREEGLAAARKAVEQAGSESERAAYAALRSDYGKQDQVGRFQEGRASCQAGSELILALTEKRFFAAAAGVPRRRCFRGS